MRRGRGKAGASSVFDSINITEFVNQNLLFQFQFFTFDRGLSIQKVKRNKNCYTFFLSFRSLVKKTNHSQILRFGTVVH